MLVQWKTITDTFYFIVSEFLVCLGASLGKENWWSVCSLESSVSTVIFGAQVHHLRQTFWRNGRACYGSYNEECFMFPCSTQGCLEFVEPKIGYIFTFTKFLRQMAYYRCAQNSLQRWIHKKTKGGPGSSVGIATDYRLDGPGIKYRWGRDYPYLSRPALGSTQPSVQWVPGLSREVESGRGVTLTTHPLVAPRFRMSRAIPLLLL
jgi:hypothetical protein